MTEGSSILPQLVATFGGNTYNFSDYIYENMFHCFNLLATLGAFGLGTVVSWPSSALFQMRSEGEIELTTSQEGLVSAMAMLGAVVVQIVAGWWK